MRGAQQQQAAQAIQEIQEGWQPEEREKNEKRLVPGLGPNGEPGLALTDEDAKELRKQTADMANAQQLLRRMQALANAPRVGDIV